MTFSKFFGFGVLVAVGTGLLTVVFDKYLNLNSSINNYVLWFVIVVFTTACVRRLGVINFLEGILTACVWLFFRMFFDILVTAPLLGLGIYKTVQLWVSYALIVVVIFFLHKKRHVHIRKELKKHHGHH